MSRLNHPLLPLRLSGKSEIDKLAHRVEVRERQLRQRQDEVAKIRRMLKEIRHKNKMSRGRRHSLDGSGGGANPAVAVWTSLPPEREALLCTK